MQATREYLEKRLRETRDELTQSDERLESKGDYGLGKGDPLIVRWELDLALREKIEQRIEQLEDALKRLKNGEYGTCESCGRPIDPERMDVLPQTTLCIQCARKVEQAGSSR